jgi:membrane associated rhomboid family serine protease
MKLEIEQHPVELHRLPWVTFALVLACGSVLAMSETDTRLAESSFVAWGVVPTDFTPIKALTHPFFHAHVAHLLGSIALLLMLGAPLEQRWSGILFLPLVAAGAMASGTAYARLTTESSIPMVGMAGVIAALLGASAMRFRGGWPLTWYQPGASGLQSLKVTLPVFALALVWVVSEIAGSIGHFNGVTGGITHWGQLGGFAAGAVVAGFVEWSGLERRMFGDAQLGKPTGPNPAIESALAARALGDLNQAVSILADAVKAGANDRDLVIHYWEMSSFAGKPQQAAPTFQRLVEKELASGERQSAADHWCELVQRVRRIQAEPRLLLQLTPLLLALDHGKEAVQTLQLAACSPELSPGMALRVVDLAADVDSPCALRAARIALTSPDLHETKRTRLQGMVRELTAQGVREVEPLPEVDPVEDRSLELPEDDFQPPVIASVVSEEAADDGFALSADGSLVTGETSGDLSGANYDEVPLADPAAQADPAPVPVPEAVSKVAPEPPLDPDGLDLEDLPGTPGLALHGLDLEAEEIEAVGALVDETPSTQVDYANGNDITGVFGDPEDDDATGPLGEAMDALDVIAMDVACEEPRFSDAKIVDVIPIDLGPDRLGLRQHGGRRGHVEFAKVDAVSVAAIHGLGSKPVVLLDLLANWTSLEGGLLRVIRMRSDQFDARALVPDAPDAVEAFKMLSQILLEQCAAVALPDPLAAVGQPFRVCEQLSDYEREILQIDR